MSRISHFKLGLFILLCAAVGAVALIWIGATHMFESSRTYAAFFGQPVVNLRPGAPVDHLGVHIGSVDSVELAPDESVVQVLVKLKSDFRVGPSMALSLDQAGITGSPFLALEDTPPGERKDLPHPATRDPVLPTRSGGGGIGGAVQGIEKKIAALDIQGLIGRWEDVARKLDAILDRGLPPQQIEAIMSDLRTTTRQLRTASAAVEKQVQAVRPGTAAVIADRLEQTTDLGEKTVRDLDESVDASVVLLRQDLAQLKQAVVEAQALARSLRAEPNRIIERGGGDDPFNR